MDPIPADTGLEHHHADVGEISIHYVSAGQGEPILFMHGFPQFWFLWRHQLADLSRDHHCVAPDMRGFNLSDKPADTKAYRMRHLLGDVHGLLDHLGWERFTLVGHDWGGIVSWAFALKNPELLERFVILDSPPPFTWSRDLRESAAQREAVSYMVPLSEPSPGPERMLAAEDFEFLFSMLEGIGGGNATLSDEERVAYREAWSQPGALTGGVNYYRAAAMGEQVAAGGVPEEYERKITARRLDVPTLVIWGEEDPALLLHLTEGLEQWVPNLRLEKLPGTGHWVPYERPDEVNGLIRGFIAESAP
jgi:epoxide hydrolase 4